MVGQSRHFQNRYYRSPIVAVFEIAGIGGPITTFHKRRYRADFFLNSPFRRF